MEIHPWIRRFLDNIVSVTALAAIFTILYFTLVFRFYGGRIEISRWDLFFRALNSATALRFDLVVAYARVLPTFEDAVVFLSPNLMPPLIAVLLSVVFTQWCLVETVKARAVGDGQRQVFLVMLMVVAIVMMIQFTSLMVPIS